MNPFGNALFDIIGIGINDQLGIFRTELDAFNRRGQLHAVIGGMIFATANFVFLLFGNYVRTPTA